MPQFNDERLRLVRIGISSYTEDELVLDVIGTANITGITTLSSSGGITSTGGDLYVSGDGYFTGVVTATTFFAGPTEITGGAIADDFTVEQFKVTGLSTFIGIATFGNDAYFAGNLYTPNFIYVNGLGSIDPFDNLDIAGIVTASRLSTGFTGDGININTDTITGPSTITIDPSGIGDNTGLLLVKGDLQVEGDKTSINSNILDFTGKVVGIASTTPKYNDTELNGAGIVIYGSDGDKSLTWDSFGTRLSFNTSVYVPELFGDGSNIEGLTLGQLEDVDVSNLSGITTDYLMIYDPNISGFRFVDPKAYFGINNDFNPAPDIVDYGTY